MKTDVNGCNSKFEFEHIMFEFFELYLDILPGCVC